MSPIYYHPGLQVRQICLPAVVQLPGVTPEAHSLPMDPSVNFGRQVWGFSDGVS